MEDKNYDIIIIGGGPAGLSAGMYASRAGYRTVIIEKLAPGGQLMLTDLIENYPGFPKSVHGFEISENFRQHAVRFKCEFITDSIEKIEKTDQIFLLTGVEKSYEGKAVIVASGSRHRKLNVPGERELAGKGVSYCGTCDGPFFRDREVAVIGGGDSAFDEACFLSKFASRVTIIHRRDRFRANDFLVKKAVNNQKIDFIYDTVVEKINGEKSVESITVKNLKTNEVTDLPYAGVFIFIGLIPNTDFLKENPLIKTNGFFSEDGQIIANEKMETTVPGLFTAGDVRDTVFRQIVVSASDGAIAAEYSGRYIDDMEGRAYI